MSSSNAELIRLDIQLGRLKQQADELERDVGEMAESVRLRREIGLAKNRIAELERERASLTPLCAYPETPSDSQWVEIHD